MWVFQLEGGGGGIGERVKYSVQVFILYTKGYCVVLEVCAVSFLHVFGKFLGKYVEIARRSRVCFNVTPTQ